jgi:hypothetical protein
MEDSCVSEQLKCRGSFEHCNGLSGFKNVKVCNDQVTSKTKQTPWPESASELNIPRDRRLSAKLVPTFTDKLCHVVSVAISSSECRSKSGHKNSKQIV